MANQEVMTWEEVKKQKQIEQALKKQGLSSTASRISFRAGILAIDKQPVPNNELSVIVLDYISENAYYPGKFDPNNTAPPICWAIYTTPDEMEPHEDAVAPQAATCKECPHYKWGSDPQGGRGKACKQGVRLVVIPATVTSAEEVLAAEVKTASVPVTSIKNFSSYISTLDTLYNGAVCFEGICNIKVQPDIKTQFQVTFTPKGVITDGEMLMALSRKSESVQDILKFAYPKPEEEAPASKKV